MTTQTLPLNLIPKGVCPRLYVSQYDKGQTWYFDLYAGTEAYTIPSGASVNIQGTKPDKTGFQYACVFSGNRVEATEQQQMTIIAGEVPAELRIEKNDEIIATLNFIIAVEKAALADDTVISETDLPLIEEAIEVLGHADELVERIEGDVTTSGNNALKAEGFAVGQQNGSDVASGSPYYHNSAKYYKEQAADSASTASNKASDASGYASAASGSSSSASTNALKAEGFAVGQQNGSDVASGSPYYHNSAKYYKEQAADSASTASTKAGEAAASAQAAAQSAAHLTIDSAMSTTSENALQNKVISTTIQNLSNQVSSLELTNAVNIIPFDCVSRDIYTVHSDGSVDMVNASASSGETRLYYIDTTESQFSFIKGKRYKLKVFGTFPSHCTFNINFWDGSNFVDSIWTAGDVKDFEWKSTYIGLRIVIIAQKSEVMNTTLKPMIVPEDFPITEWLPVAKSNRELTTDKVGMDLLADVGAVNYLDSDIATQTALSGAVTITANSDGSYAYSGTVAGGSNQTILSNKTVKLKKGTYKWFASQDGKSPVGSAHGINCFIKGVNGTNDWYRSYDGTAHQCGVINITQDSTIQFGICLYNQESAKSVSGTFYPAIYPVSYNGGYIPYAKTNRELTEELTVSTTIVTNGASFSFAKYGKVVILTMAGSALGADYTADQTICNIPSGYYPKIAYDFLTTNIPSSKQNFVRLVAQPDGRLTTTGTLASTDALRGSATWITA